MQKISEILKKNSVLHFFVKAFKHINDKEYLEFFINRENNPMLLEFENRGQSCIGDCIYLIEEVGEGYGFFAEFHTMLQKLIFAETFHLKPYVRWGKEFLYYEEDIKSTQNAYEYLFEPINGELGNRIDRAELLTISKKGQAGWIEEKYHRGYDLSGEYLAKAADVYRRYIRLNSQTAPEMQKEIHTLLGDKKTLAVHYRGTDFKMNYDNHPVCVTLEQELKVIRQTMREEGFEQIFLATDDKAAVEAFRAEFKKQIVFYSDVARSNSTTSVAFSKSNREMHHYLLAYEVLRDMLTLAACDGLVAGVSQVSICARIAKASEGKEYTYVHIIDNGKNYNNKKFKAHKCPGEKHEAV